LLAFSALFAVAGFFAVRFPNVPGTAAGSLVSTALIALPAFRAFLRRFGLSRALVALAALSIFGFAVEVTGVATGFPYGEFRYGDQLGPKLGGLVPYGLPISWAPLVLGAVAATEPRLRPVSPRVAAGWVLAAAALLVALDGVLDPGAAHLGFWVWPDGGVYFGVPLSNYAGWLLSSALAASLLISLAPWRDTRPAPGMLDSAIVSLAFWSSVALFARLWAPALLGCALFAALLWRRSALAGTVGTRPAPVAAGAGSARGAP
jgi:putative membrane protein